MRLFRAYSILKEFAGHADVRIYWLCAQRESPLVRYEEFINGQDVPPDFKTALARYEADEPGGEFVGDIEAIDELFSEEEVEELRRYLTDTFPEDAGADVHVEEATWLSCDDYVHSLRELSQCKDTGEFCLHEAEGYKLSISINGFYGPLDLYRVL